MVASEWHKARWGGAVIKAGTYKWVDTPDIQGITDIIGEDGGFDGQFKSSNISFETLEFSIHQNHIRYYPPENFSSLIEGNNSDFAGYDDGKWGVQQQYKPITEISSIQTFTVLEDYDLSKWQSTEIEQAILTWFTTNTIKLS